MWFWPVNRISFHSGLLRLTLNLALIIRCLHCSRQSSLRWRWGHDNATQHYSDIGSISDFVNYMRGGWSNFGFRQMIETGLFLLEFFKNKNWRRRRRKVPYILIKNLNILKIIFLHFDCLRSQGSSLGSLVAGRSRSRGLDAGKVLRFLISVTSWTARIPDSTAGDVAPGAKRQRRVADHSSASSARLKHCWALPLLHHTSWLV
jgi:hypothetical protein